jgi:hypothetical protein
MTIVKRVRDADPWLSWVECNVITHGYGPGRRLLFGQNPSKFNVGSVDRRA